MPPIIEDEYYTVGGNRNTAAADWSTVSGLVSFGADQNVTVWSPFNDSRGGISCLLSGHTSKVTAVKFLSSSYNATANEYLITGAGDGELRLWKAGQRWECIDKASAHEGSVNTVAVLSQSSIFATGGADAKVRLWKVDNERLQALSTFTLQPRFIPLALALGPFSATADRDSAFLVAGGTRNDIQVYAIENLSTTPQIKLCATLPGHEAWIRSLALTPVPEGGFLLASASQDKYVRLWRFQCGGSAIGKKTVDASGLSNGMTLTAKVQSVSAGNNKYSITFEALLLGHEDWVYSAAWNPNQSILQLLTASADGSLSVWESDPVSGIWISVSRLGEISGQKGATTATGSAGGFWTGLWSPNGDMITCLGRTGSWRLWQYNAETQFWTQKHAVSGHINSVNGICWSPDGSYLLSTSSDQTTRLHAEWKRGAKRSWHEFSRPQIHGYDLNCIATTTPHQFSSGADEKLLRVFNEPKDIASMLRRLCQIPLPDTDQQLPDTAAIPVLGLSNKAMDDDPDETPDASISEVPVEARAGGLLLDIQEPPTEDLLARHTLWPEHEKLYGHGYEISEAAAPADGSILATACKASSVDHAVVRLYDTSTWNEIKPPLKAHSLTVTRLAFSAQPAGYLLSVGRDRQFAVFRRSDGSWTRVAANIKAHSRMILDAAWLANGRRPTFATAGRDKVVKVWVGVGDPDTSEFVCRAQITRKTAVTAVAVLSRGARSVIAAGEDDGTVSLHLVECDDESDSVNVTSSADVESHLCPSKTVNRLAWRPTDNHDDEEAEHLAIASADGSVRIWRVNWRGWTDV